jgi:predicted HicB family RNase H-like nuclease
MPASVVQFQVRMPPALHEKLASLAHDNRESINSFVVRYLAAGVDAREARREPVVIPSPQVKA